jgi:23S rRNA (uracil1939-C5)-methyltransferase
MEPGAELELEIGELGPGGVGVARAADGRVVLVSGALAGERVRARVDKALTRRLEATAVAVLEASPQRVEPACGLYGRCGGCDLMHLDHPGQVEAKAAWLANALRGLGAPAPRVHPSPEPWAWRHRVRLQVGEAGVGFFGRASRQVVPVGRCAIAAPEINQLLPRLNRAGLFAWPLAWLELLGGGGRALACAGLAAPPGREAEAALGQALAEAGAQGVRFALRGRLGPWPAGEGLECLRLAGVSLEAQPGLFCQANWRANRALVREVLAMAGAAGPQPVLDLFAGSGNFALPLAAAGHRTTAVEGLAPAVQAGQAQARRAGLAGGLEWVRRPVAQALAGLAAEGRRFAVVVLDPPRAGAKGLMPAVAALAPRRVVYVSCHAAALGRDARALVEEGYEPVDLALVDMFPQTTHLEAVLALERP